MAVTDVKLIQPGISIEENERFAQVYRGRYKIETDQERGPIHVQQQARLFANGIPNKGDSFLVNGEADLSSFALEFRWERSPDTALRWFCDVTWRPLNPRETTDTVTEPDPLARPAILWWEFEEYTEIVERARNITNLTGISRAPNTDGPLVNAAGGPFDTPFERTASRAVLVISRNYASLADVREVHDMFAGKLNSDPYQGAAIKTLLCRRVTSGQPLTENGVTYYPGMIWIAYEPDTWKWDPVNRGFGYLKSGVYTTTNEAGEVFNEPILLALDGTKLAPATLGNWVEYEYADTVSFATIDQEPP